MNQLGVPHPKQGEVDPIDAVEQPLPATEHHWCEVQPLLVDQAGGKVLVDGCRPSRDRDVLIAARARWRASLIPPVTK